MYSLQYVCACMQKYGREEWFLSVHILAVCQSHPIIVSLRSLSALGWGGVNDWLTGGLLCRALRGTALTEVGACWKASDKVCFLDSPSSLDRLCNITATLCINTYCIRQESPLIWLNKQKTKNDALEHWTVFTSLAFVF